MTGDLVHQFLRWCVVYVMTLVYGSADW